MNFEPQKIFIGLVDFFSILMPGAMLTYLGKDWLAVKFGLEQGFLLEGTEAIMVFLFSSYLLGHFIFLVSSLLDDLVYDPIRAWTEYGQICKRLAKGKTLSASWKRNVAVSKWLFGGNADNAVIQAQRIKARALHGLEAQDAINAFQWCKVLLTKVHPDGLPFVQRFEADSKFFRSFVVVLGVLTLFYLFQCKLLAASLCFVGIFPALWRFIDQRFKATQQAYWFVIMLEGVNTDHPISASRSDGLTHAGGVVYRQKDQPIEFLLLQSSEDRSQWVFPKGHIEFGEDTCNTAVREVYEETGCLAKIVSWLEDKNFCNAPETSSVRWYLLELIEEATEWPEENRQHEWLGYEAAIKKLAFVESKKLLETAKTKLDEVAQRKTFQHKINEKGFIAGTAYVWVFNYFRSNQLWQLIKYL